MKNLPKSFSRQFQDMNAYVRMGKPAKWEQDFIREQGGGAYEEDKQTYKRLQDRDYIRGTEVATYYEHFHCLWYWNNGEDDWSKELRSARRKDIYTEADRVSIDASVDYSNGQDDSYSVEMTHNTSFDLQKTEKTSDIISITKNKTRYSAQDYQYIINPYSCRWSDLVIDNIDKSRGANESQDIDVGLVKLARGQTRWGIENTSRQSIYIVSMVIPGKESIRESFTSLEDARDFLEKEKKYYSNMSFSYGNEEGI